MDHFLRISRIKDRKISVKGSIIKWNSNKSIQCRHWMVWLIFLNVTPIFIDEEKSLQKLDIMNETNKLVSSIAIWFGTEASKINDTKNSKDHLNGVNNNSNLHEYLTSLNMIFLNPFHGFDEVFFLVHEWLLFFVTILYFLNFLRSIYALSFRVLVFDDVSFFLLLLLFLRFSFASGTTFLLRNIRRWVDIWFSMLFTMFLWYLNTCIKTVRRLQLQRLFLYLIFNNFRIIHVAWITFLVVFIFDIFWILVWW